LADLPYDCRVNFRQLVAFLALLLVPIAVAAQANPFDQPIKPPAVAGATIDTPHLSVMTGASADKVTLGGKVSLTLDITPRRGIHVYAPGKHTYQVVRVTLEPQPWLRVPATTYPASEIYHFEPLDERVEVYQKPFRLSQDITVLTTPDAQKQLAGMKTVTVGGKLDYQACDDKVCFAPRSVPVKWTFTLEQ
jgi:Thiol:disulfide interchange protein DsbD, N-terminal